MLMRAFSLLFMILSLTNCAGSHESTATYAPVQGNTQTHMTGAFTRVQVDGNIDVKLVTGDANPRVILHGDPRDLIELKVTVNNGLLHISSEKKGFPRYGRVQAEIRSHYLLSFSYLGQGTIVGNNVQSGWLDLVINNKGNTTLQGKLALHSLDVSGSGRTNISGISGNMTRIKLGGKARVQLAGNVDIANVYTAGNSWVSLHWVQSRVLKIRAKDNAFIQMAGVTETLDVGLHDHARFNGRYLRGTNVFVKTWEHATADVSAVKTQHSLASDSSNIYFHNLPTMKADFMAFDGSVLDMREWELPELKEYTRYNR